MNCAQARLLIGAAPRGADAALAAHLESCAECRALRAEMLRLEGDIERALQQPPQLARRRRGYASGWQPWAMAASVLLACAAVLGVWLLRPSDSLAHDLVKHVKAEPESWLAAQQVSADGIEAALKNSGVAIDLTSDKVTYAQSCWFHGHYVPHLVVQTAQGPATVLLLRHEQVKSRRSFHESGMTGVIVPAANGAIAVLAHGGDVDTLASAMQQDVRWLPDSN